LSSVTREHPLERRLRYNDAIADPDAWDDSFLAALVSGIPAYPQPFRHLWNAVRVSIACQFRTPCPAPPIRLKPYTRPLRQSKENGTLCVPYGAHEEIMKKKVSRHRDPKAPKSTHLSTRFPAALRSRLQTAADDNKTTLSHEIARRLELSFTEEPRSAAHFGDATTRAALLKIARAFYHLRNVTGHAWTEHPFTFRHAVEAIADIIDDYIPEGDPNSPPEDILDYIRPAKGETDAEALLRIRDYPLGRVYAQAVLAEFDFAIAGDIPDAPADAPSPEMTRTLLHVASHPVVKRVRRSPHVSEIASVGRPLKYRKERK
jgi:hypothetical protein